MIGGVIRNAKAISLKLWVWPVPVEKPFMGKASRQPMTPPTTARNTDSITNENRIARREKPSARSVPISRVRAATIAYIVFMAPNTAPMPMTTATKLASALQHAGERAGLVLVVLALLDGLELHLRLGPDPLVERGDVRRVLHPHHHGVGAGPALEDRAEDVEVAPDLALEGAALRLEDPDDLELLALVLDRPAEVAAPGCARQLLPTITSSRPGLKATPSTMSMPPRTSKLWGGTARSVTLVGCPSLSLGSAITTTHSQDASGLPSAARATRSSTTIMLRWSSDTPEVSSEAEPRWTMIALSGGRSTRSASAKPSDIESSTVNTATTSAMPPIASSVTCQRTRTLRTL